MTPLIVRIHETHTKRGLFEPTCCLCVEAHRRAEAKANRPAWFGRLTAKEMGPRSAA